MLTHKGSVALTTPRLTLRPLTPDDSEDMFNNWANDERVTRFLTWLPHSSPEKTKELLTLWYSNYSNPDYYNWAIVYEGHPIGNISVVRISERDEYAELGYCIGHAYWGKGIMTEAASAVTDYLFKEVGMNKVSISHAVKNPASGEVAKKCGMKFEGTSRQDFKSAAGEFLDISHYSILRSEWEEKYNK